MRVSNWMKLGLIALMLTALPAVAEDMNLDQVLEKYYEARGGLSNIKKVDSAVMKGKMVMGGAMEAPVHMTWMRPNFVRVEFEMQGMKGVQALDGDKGAWQMMPFMGITKPQAMNDEEAAQVAEMADFDGPLVDWKSKGHAVKLIGKEEIEGTPAYKLELTQKNGNSSTHYIDAEHFIEIKTKAKRTQMGQEMETATTISDYKQVGELMLAHSMSTQAGPMTIEILLDDIQLGADVDKSIFTKPAE